MTTPDVNPYASPVAAPVARVDCLGRVVVRFRLEDDVTLLRSIRAHMPGETAESAGCAAFMVGFILATTFIVYFAPSELWLFLVAYGGGAVIGFIVRAYALRWLARRYLRKLHELTGATAGDGGRIELTRTKLLLDFQKRCFWSLREIGIHYNRRLATRPPFLLMTVVAGNALVVPVPSSAELDGFSPEEWIELLQRRRTACQHRTRRLWMRRLRRFWPVGRNAPQR
jgi:hypothetical protein